MTDGCFDRAKWQARMDGLFGGYHAADILIVEGDVLVRGYPDPRPLMLPSAIRRAIRDGTFIGFCVMDEPHTYSTAGTLTGGINLL